MVYSFGDYRLDTDAHELTRAGVEVAVEPRTFALLKALVSSRDTVLTKEDLIDAVWEGRHTSDEAIAGRVKQARKAIGDDGKSQRLIKTIHGVGYRFIGEATGGVDVGVQMAAESQAEPPIDSRPVILVMPFLEGQRKDSVTAMGLSHDVTIGLSRLRWLKVISWLSAMQLQADESESLRPLTAADYSLAAWVENQGSRLELAVELTSLKDNTIVWADRFKSSNTEINELRAELVQQAVSALELRISAAEAAKAQYLHTSNLDAWSNYHLGLMHMYRFNGRDNALAIGYFERAIKLQPDFARAYAGLSFALFQTVFNRYDGQDLIRCQKNAIAMAERSVQLDEYDPFANFVMGRSFWLDGDVAAGQPWLERALTISGNFAQAHYAHGLGAVMLDEESSAGEAGHMEASAAIALSPLDPFMYGFFGVRALSFLRGGQNEEARLWANRAARQPNAIAAMDFIAAASNEVAGKHEEATRWANRARERSAGADSSYFFKALPFVEGPLRTSMETAFQNVGLSSAK